MNSEFAQWFEENRMVLIVGCVVLVWLLDHYGRSALGARGANIGFPLPRARKVFPFTAPQPIPPNWLPTFSAIGNDRFVVPDGPNHICFGVLGVHHGDGETEIVMERRLPFGYVAIAAMLVAFALRPEADGGELLVPVYYGLIVFLQSYRGYSWLGKAVREVGERLHALSR